MTVRRLGVLSVGKMMGALYAVFGLLAGGLFTLMALVGASMGGGAQGGGAAALFGIGAIVVFPLIYGVLGFLGGLLMAALYNLMANFLGGVEFEAS